MPYRKKVRPTKRPFGPPAGCHIRATVGANPVADVLAEQLPESTREDIELIEGREWIDVLLAGKRLVSNGWDGRVVKDVLVTADGLYRAIVSSANDILPDAKPGWKRDERDGSADVTPAGPDEQPGDPMVDETDVSSTHVEGPSE